MSPPPEKLSPLLFCSQRNFFSGRASNALDYQEEAKAVSAACLSFDDIIADFCVEQTIRRLKNLRAEVSAFRPELACTALGDRRALMKRLDSRCLDGEEVQLERLVAKSKRGDSAAMEALIERYQPRIAGFVLANVSEGEAVEDLCQTIFYKMLAGLPRLAAVEKFEAWLFRIARNACFDYLRRRRLRHIFLPWTDVDDRLTTPAMVAEPTSDHRVAAFREALTRLPRKQRELVALLQDDRLTYEKLAKITRTSVSSVKSRLFRARRQLRSFLQDDL